MRDRIIVALDRMDARGALDIVDRLGSACSFYKVGLELFVRAGPDIARELSRRKKRVFLDLKLHDIPATAAAAAAAVSRMGCELLTLHALGGVRMMRAARDSVANGLALLGVTLLTSIDSSEAALIFERAGADAKSEAVRLSRLVAQAGLSGAVCSVREVRLVRKELGAGAVIVTPGIRPPGARSDDQRRTGTAREAFALGASYVVAGRAVTAAPDPGAAFEALLEGP